MIHEVQAERGCSTFPSCTALKGRGNRFLVFHFLAGNKTPKNETIHAGVRFGCGP